MIAVAEPIGRVTRWSRTATFLAAAVLLQLPGESRGQESVVDGPQAWAPVADDVLAFLEARAAFDTDSATVWRLLGRAYWQRDRLDEARDAFEQAVQADPDSVAANFDLARFLWQRNGRHRSAGYFQHVVELLPESEFAVESQTYLAQISEAGDGSEIELAGFEIKRFDGSDVADEEGLPDGLGDEGVRPFYFRLEMGALYNSNVALSPINRELSANESAAAQGFVSPKLEYRLLNRDDWRLGPVFSGYFNLNDGSFDNFNLQNYRPGAFIEHSRLWDTTIVTPRLQYDFTHDEFDGNTLGNRHAATASTEFDFNERHTSFVYTSVDYTNFLQDGLFPEVSSQDGWTYTAGASHTFYTGLRYLFSVTGGIDMQWAETTGSNFAYRGVSVYGSTQIPICDTWSAELQGGWGYRDYPNFIFTPSRNEHIWRAGVELRKYLTDYVSLAGVFNFDRFMSQNEVFDARRFISGLILRVEY